jgi:hypothetical protein
VPHRQWHQSTGNPIRSMALVVKTSTDPLSLVGPIRQEIRSLDPNLPVANVQAMSEVVGATLSSPRFTGFLLLTFTAIALALSAIGIYGCSRTSPAGARARSVSAWRSVPGVRRCHARCSATG